MNQYNVPVGEAALRGPRYLFRNPAGPAVVAQAFIGTSGLVDLYVILTGGADSPLVREGLAWIGVLQVTCWITFLFWFHRVRCNAEVLAPGSHRYAPAFAVGAWIIPLAMWWLPRRITLDIRRAGGAPRDTLLINAWWFVWLCDGPLSVAVHHLVLHHTDFHTPMDHGTGLLCSILAIAVVRRVTADQPAGPLPYFNMT
ncbi:DUF4328 domain-containing protein [Streptomyces yangpuensis]|uniref:DUF4328 domain-containing protein n=1 Tax=Streptomyces yangpuensis TaxID=1648182 RepID=UPI00381A26AF